MFRKIVVLTIVFLFPFTLSAQFETMDTLVVGYEVSAPFVFHDEDQLRGVSVWLWKAINEEHPIPHKIAKVSLDSLLNGLASGAIDLSLSPLTITSERAEKMDFSSPYFIAYASILTHSSSAGEKALAYVRSFFSLNFFKALGALILVILAFGFVEWLFERKGNEEEFGKGIKGLWSGFWWSAVTMTTVGYGDKSPRTTGGRIVALVWMFTAIIIISGFTASIASSLTVNQLSFSNNQIEDFKDKKLGTIKGSRTEEWLTQNFFTKKNKYMNLPELTEALRGEEIDAIAYDEPILKDIIKADTLREFELLPINYNSQFYAMGFSNNLPDTVKELVSTTILSITESMDWKVLLSEYDLEKK